MAKVHGTDVNSKQDIVYVFNLHMHVKWLVHKNCDVINEAILNPVAPTKTIVEIVKIQFNIYL